MANDTKRRLGELVSVANTSRKFGSANDYWVVYVQVDGAVLPLALTPREYGVARIRAGENPEDMPGYRKRFTERFRRKR